MPVIMCRGLKPPRKKMVDPFGRPKRRFEPAFFGTHGTGEVHDLFEEIGLCPMLDHTHKRGRGDEPVGRDHGQGFVVVLQG